MEEIELIMKARESLRHSKPVDIAERLILFPVLLAALEKCEHNRAEVNEARICLRSALLDFRQTMRQIRTATGEWNLGAALTRMLNTHTQKVFVCAERMEKAALDEPTTPPAMMGANRGLETSQHGPQE